jgi:hypothetical protein
MHLFSMKTILIIAVALTFVSCNSAAQTGEEIKISDCSVSTEFIQYANKIVSDTNVFKDFGTPPPLTCEILVGLEKELEVDSARFYFEKLGRPLYVRENLGAHHLSRCVNYFKANRLHFCLLAISVHWSPDLRIHAVEAIYQSQVFKLLANYSQEGLQAHHQMEQTVLKFLIYILENTKWALSGSENVTIQGRYSNEIYKILDFIVHGILPTDEAVQSNNGAIRIENWKKGIEE